MWLLKELATLAALGMFISAIFVWADFLSNQSVVYNPIASHIEMCPLNKTVVWDGKTNPKCQ